MLNTREIMQLSPVMPVIVIEKLADAIPLARALVAGGIRVLEVTLRTTSALDAIRAILAEVPGAIVGAGTVTSAAQYAACVEAGAVFAVSPGLTRELAATSRGGSMPLLPGVMTPSDVMAASALGYDAMKLFPAEQAGGIGMLRAMSGPFADVMFCPTGGVTLASAPNYLALPNVGCVGGSWLTPKDCVQRGDWAAITELARQAAALRPAN